MSIFEDLENLNVSEECFDDIMGIVEAILNEKDNNKYKEDLDTRGWLTRPYWEEPESKTKKHHKSLNTRLNYYREQYKRIGKKAEEEKDRADNSDRTIHANRGEHTDFHRDDVANAISNKDYQRYKKIATKALKGHSRSSVDIGDTEAAAEKGELPWAKYTANDKYTKPNALYRLGKKIEAHKKNK